MSRMEAALVLTMVALAVACLVLARWMSEIG